MAKIRRKTLRSAQKRTPAAKHRRRVSVRKVTAAPKKAPAHQTSVAPLRRPRYEEAVASYEAALKAIQMRQFTRAKGLLEALIDRFPEERELHERARLYLRVCERQIEMQSEAPVQSVPERVTEATVALNAGRAAEAVSALERIVREDSRNDHAEYVLAVGYATLGNAPAAVAHLSRAITLNPENRALARNEPDFDGLRRDPAFEGLVDSSAGARRRPRPARSSR